MATAIAGDCRRLVKKQDTVAFSDLSASPSAPPPLAFEIQNQQQSAGADDHRHLQRNFPIPIEDTRGGRRASSLSSSAAAARVVDDRCCRQHDFETPALENSCHVSPESYSYVDNVATIATVADTPIPTQAVEVDVGCGDVNLTEAAEGFSSARGSRSGSGSGSGSGSSSSSSLPPTAQDRKAADVATVKKKDKDKDKEEEEEKKPVATSKDRYREEQVSNMVADICSMLGRPEYLDARFICEGGDEVRGNRSVLASQSPLFHRLLFERNLAMVAGRQNRGVWRWLSLWPNGLTKTAMVTRMTKERSITDPVYLRNVRAKSLKVIIDYLHGCSTSLSWFSSSFSSPSFPFHGGDSSSSLSSEEILEEAIDDMVDLYCLADRFGIKNLKRQVLDLTSSADTWQSYERLMGKVLSKALTRGAEDVGKAVITGFENSSMKFSPSIFYGWTAEAVSFFLTYVCIPGIAEEDVAAAVLLASSHFHRAVRSKHENYYGPSPSSLLSSSSFSSYPSSFRIPFHSAAFPSPSSSSSWQETEASSSLESKHRSCARDGDGRVALQEEEVDKAYVLTSTKSGGEGRGANQDNKKNDCKKVRLLSNKDVRQIFEHHIRLQYLDPKYVAGWLEPLKILSEKSLLLYYRMQAIGDVPFRPSDVESNHSRSIWDHEHMGNDVWTFVRGNCVSCVDSTAVARVRLPLSKGSHTWRVRVVDKAGGRSNGFCNVSVGVVASNVKGMTSAKSGHQSLAVTDNNEILSLAVHSYGGYGGYGDGAVRKRREGGGGRGRGWGGKEGERVVAQTSSFNDNHDHQLDESMAMVQPLDRLHSVEDSGESSENVQRAFTSKQGSWMYHMCDDSLCHLGETEDEEEREEGYGLGDYFQKMKTIIVVLDMDARTIRFQKEDDVILQPYADESDSKGGKSPVAFWHLPDAVCPIVAVCGSGHVELTWLEGGK